MRKRASERARKKESENRQNERDRETPWRAGESCFEEGRKTEKEIRRERERGKLKSKQQRHRTQERGRDREYTVIRAAHISGYRTPLITRPDSTPSQCLSVRKPILFG